MRVRRLARPALALVIGSMLVAGCDGTDPGPEPAAATSTATTRADESTPDLHATLTQSRIHEGTRLINAQLVNRADTPVTVTSVALHSAANAPLPPTPKDTVFGPGAIIDLATRFGDPRCGSSSTADAPAFTVGLSDGSSVEVPLDAAGAATLRRFDERACTLEQIARIASIRWQSSFVRTTIHGQRYLRGALVLRRPDDAAAAGTAAIPLRVDELEGSVLVRVRGLRGSVPATLPAGRGVLRVPVLISPFRCDQHARAGSSQTFLLSVFVTAPGVAGSPRQGQRIIAVPGRHLQRQTLALIDAVCG